MKLPSRIKKSVPRPKLPPKLSKPKLDRVWSEMVKIRDGHRCILCGSRQALNSHHIMLKRAVSMRYELDNGATLCAGCHLGGVHSPDAAVVLRTVTKLKEKIGEERWERLWTLRQNPPRITLTEAYERLTA